VKKFQPVEMRGDGEGRGYERMGDVCRDLGEVVDVLWRSGTREFALPFLSFSLADCFGGLRWAPGHGTGAAGAAPCVGDGC
jgi:hypothetical protein